MIISDVLMAMTALALICAVGSQIRGAVGSSPVSDENCRGGHDF